MSGLMWLILLLTLLPILIAIYYASLEGEAGPVLPGLIVGLFLGFMSWVLIAGSNTNTVRDKHTYSLVELDPDVYLGSSSDELVFRTENNKFMSVVADHSTIKDGDTPSVTVYKKCTDGIWPATCKTDLYADFVIPGRQVIAGYEVD